MDWVIGLVRRLRRPPEPRENLQDDELITINRVSSRLEGAEERTVYINIPIPESECDKHGQPKHRFPTNKIRSSKYTITTFIPRNLFEQFRRAANVYFLVTAIIQVIPVFGIDNPGFAVLPIVVVLFLTACKDGYEDYRRHISDNEFNSTPTCRLIHWRNQNFGNPNTTYRRFLLVIARVMGVLGLGALAPSVPTRIDHDTVYTNAPVSAPGAVKPIHYQSPAESLEMERLTPQGDSLATSHPSVPLPPVTTRRSIDSERSTQSHRRSFGRTSSIPDESLTRVSISDDDGRYHRPKFGESIWEELYVGDIILLRNNESVPADMVILSTSEDDGTCYIETMNLDGETNLKVRNCVQDTARIQTAKDCARLQAFIKSDPPSSNLSSHFATMTVFENSLPDATRRSAREASVVDADPATGIPYHCEYRGHPEDGPRKILPITIKNMLLRGCVVRNTDFVIGIALFTGPESKIMLNSGETPSKRSRIERTMNYMVVANFVVVVVLSLVMSIGAAVYWQRWIDEDVPWAAPTDSVGVVYVLTFWQTLILLQNIIPISLYVSLELIKTCQAYFMYQDLGMYYAPTDRNCSPRTWNISDDLGQVQYVFSDKTGTLTCNIMEFRKCTVAGHVYGKQLPGDELDVERGKANIAKEEERIAEETFEDALPPNDGYSPASSENDSQGEVLSYHSLDIDDINYGKDETLAHRTGFPLPTDVPVGQSFRDPDSRRTEMIDEYVRAMRSLFTPQYVDLEGTKEDAFSCVDSQIFRDLMPLRDSLVASTSNHSSPQLRHAERVRDFFLFLALCHTALVEKPERRQEDIERERGDYSSVEQGSSGNDSEDHTSEYPPLESYKMGHRWTPDQRRGGPPLRSPPDSEESGPKRLSEPFSDTTHVGSERPLSLPTSPGGSTPGHSPPQDTRRVPFTPVNYRAESPDESALVKAAKNFGFTFLGRQKDKVHLDILGKPYTFTQLAVLEFNSTRKRMSVLLRRPAPWNDIILCCKGADNVIMELLKPGQDDIRDTTLEHVDHFSNQGLRVLCLAYRIVSEAEYQRWVKGFNAAQITVEDREEKLAQCANEMERDFTLLGATAIEDKLQEEVPESIAALRDAGIHVWVLTGDKLETAINIGFASSLLTRDMEVWTIRKAEQNTVLDRFRVVANIILKQGVQSGLIQTDDLLKSDEDRRGFWSKLWRGASFMVSGPKPDPSNPGSRGWFFNCGLGPTIPYGGRGVTLKRWSTPGTRRRRYKAFFRALRVRRRLRRDQHLQFPADDHYVAEMPDSTTLTTPDSQGHLHRHRTTLRRLRTLFRNRHRLENLQNQYGMDEPSAVATSYRASRLSLRSFSQYSTGDLERGLSPNTRLSFCGTRRFLQDDVSTDDTDEESERELGNVNGSPLSNIHEAEAFTKEGYGMAGDDFSSPSSSRRESPRQGKRGLRSRRTRRRRSRIPSTDLPISSSGHALVIDGTSLKYILGSPLHAKLLQQIAPACKSVICCRVSPLQKAQVVQLIRQGHDVVTLAIGDGANDVSMIQQANVGVAIAGEEGMQASMASDFTIARFRFLRNLLLVQGTWCYLRIAETVLYFFYKNVIWSFGTFWFQFFDGYSANFFYDYSYFQLYNMVFTSLPVIILGIGDKATNYQTALQFPGMYKLGIRGTHLSMRRFWVYQWDGVWQSAVSYFVFHFIFYRASVPSHFGSSMGQFDMSTPVVFTVVMVVTLFLGLKTYSWNWLFIVSMVGSVIVLFAYTPIYALFYNTDLTGITPVVYGSGMFWFGTLLGVVASLLLVYTFSYIGATYHPEDLDIIREREKYHHHGFPTAATVENGTVDHAMALEQKGDVPSANAREWVIVLPTAMD
ncbi:hypothetical protein IWQ61_007376 [Dispira simplex]|nr:hypothetical protein IWQ61_007376 [Dispira simplex]